MVGHIVSSRGRNWRVIPLIVFALVGIAIIILWNDRSMLVLVGNLYPYYTTGFSSNTTTVPSTNNAAKQQPQQELPHWRRGYLDIHHIRAGASVSTFIIFPDGTTLLIDCGEVDIVKQQKWWKELGYPYDQLKLKHPYPNDIKTPTEWIIDYIQTFWPHNSQQNKKNYTLDYALLTHFHGDHMGQPPSSPTAKKRYSSSGKYILSGITEIGEHFHIQTLIDRGYPNYTNPKQLMVDEPQLENYLLFIDEKTTATRKMNVERFMVGTDKQIRMLHASTSSSNDDNFRVYNIKANFDVYDPSAHDNHTKTIQGMDLTTIDHWNENELSTAIVIEYGLFRYYEGGDQESHYINNNKNNNTIPLLFDTITPTAQAVKQVVEQHGMGSNNQNNNHGGAMKKRTIDVATLNHHGHGLNSNFVNLLNPKFLVLQAWCSDQPPMKNIELLLTTKPEAEGIITNQQQQQQQQQQQERFILATDLFEERIQEMQEKNKSDLVNLFFSTAGHVVVRVYPPPHSNHNAPPPRTDKNNNNNNNNYDKNQKQQQQYYEIFVLNSSKKIKAQHGPYYVGG